MCGVRMLGQEKWAPLNQTHSKQRQPVGIREADLVIKMLPEHFLPPPPTEEARTHTFTEKNKSEFQVTIQSIQSQSAIIGWRRMAREQKSIGQRG